jgi:LysM repeat protein
MNEEMNEQNAKTLASPKLSRMALIVVLGVHVLAITGFIVYSLLKGNVSGKDHAEMIAGPEDSGETATVAAGGSQPTIETNAGEANVSAPMAADLTVSATAAPVTPMPGPQEPIWHPTTGGPSVPAPAPAPVTANAGVVYTVQKGDSLYKIARQSGITVAELKQANGLVSDALQPGQTLNLPAALTVPAGGQVASASAQSAARAVATGSAAASFQSYKVAPGDTLWKIARQFNTKPDVIARANNISDPSKLKVGMEIKVPVPARETAQPAAQPQAAVPDVDVAALPHIRS